MAGWTNKGKFTLLGTIKGTALTTAFRVILITSAVIPDEDTNFMGEMTEIAVGNDYNAGGALLSAHVTDFDTHTEDDTNDRGLIQIRDVAWTANGGSIPDSGTGARYAILTDNNATASDRIIFAYFDLTTARTISDGQTLTLQDLELRLDES